MTTQGMYRRLRESFIEAAGDAFDGHVLACIFVVAMSEANGGRTLADSLGISGKLLIRHIEQYFPAALASLKPLGLDGEVTSNDDERCLRKLLLRFRTEPSPLSAFLSILIARRATRPNHLWQDLGLANRGELSALMQRHFSPLALRNRQDMKWKKFFFRMICRDEGFALCTAPCCSECTDFESCFGDESGESLLAKMSFHQKPATGIYPELA